MYVLSIIAPCLILSACQTSQINFSSSQKLTMTISDASGEVEKEDIKLPYKEETRALSGKIVTFRGEKLDGEKWLFIPTDASTIDARIKLTEAQAITKEEKEPVLKNSVARNLLKAYRAVFSRKLKLAIAIADNISKIDPELSAPFIIKGLAYLKDGDRKTALVHLEKAQVLDPEDKSISVLIESIK